jgi:hypothetical protein
MSGSDGDQTAYWFYRTADGHETGPVLLSRLRQLARKGELFADSQVRRGRLGDWVEAATIPALPVKARPNRQALPRMPAPAVEAPPGPSREDSSQLWRSFVYWYYDAIQSILDRMWLIRRVGSIAALLLITVAFGRMILPENPWSFAEAKADPYETFRALGSEVRQKREAKASDDDWKELAERGRREIRPLVATLERQASSTNRLSQMLLWAGRDCLPKMFDDARDEPSASERDFEEYMRNVDMLRQNKPIYGGNAGATHFHDQQVRETPWYDTDPGTAVVWGAIILVDAAIVLWLLRTWRQKSA